MTLKNRIALLVLMAPLAGCVATSNDGGEVAPPTPSGGASSSPMVEQLLTAATELAQQQGFRPSTPAVRGHLNNGTQEDVPMTLSAGREYLLLGVCDGDCSDMDIRLMDPAGNVVGEDVEDDDAPVVKLTAGASGRYSMRVMMPACSGDPCAYGVGVYAK
ncbi:MAG TPA: hypothetical protein VE913_09675, partial [Longimicrobium sp.]|nr:hypothetical protein [Longimicrobium sp.]